MPCLERSLRTASLALLLVYTFGTWPAAAQAPSTATPIPSVTGPVPVTAESYPLMASAHLQTLVDLPKAGYVEEEFFVSGRANVYDWATDGRLSVKTPAAPYTTRILLRRPTDARRFSGNVIVEIANAARRFDFNFTWGVSHDHLIENGDAFVVVTIAQGNIDGLKAFNATRYAPLSMANPTADEACAAPGRAGGAPQTSPFEEGLQWDILSQVAALLKAAPAGGPMAGFTVQRAYMTAYDGVMATYMAAIHPSARLASGRPVYDGYVQHRHPGLARIRRCAPAPADDPRQVLRGLDVPLIRIMPETDVLTLYRFRREDSDAPNDRYRLYEVAGGAHADGAFYPFQPSVADLKKIGSPYPYLAAWPFHNQCEPEMLLMKTPINTYVLDAALTNLTRWVRDGVAPPKAMRISVENGGTPQARVVRDQFGNAMGGVRTPYLDVPIATYHTTTRGETFCPELGRTDPFSWGRLATVHGTPQNYATKVSQSVDRLVKDRWLTESDGKKIKAKANAVATAAGN